MIRGRDSLFNWLYDSLQLNCFPYFYDKFCLPSQIDFAYYQNLILMQKSYKYIESLEYCAVEYLRCKRHLICWYGIENSTK